MPTVDLSRFDNSANRYFDVGRSLLVRSLWFFVGAPVLRCSLMPWSFVRSTVLRMFGAAIGEGAVIKPGVQIKFPWKLRMGRHCWLGESCWIDNMAQVTFGDSVCISQGAYLCTGNHDWSDPAFSLIAKPIVVNDGAWIAARASIGPGVVIGCGSVVGFGAVAMQDVPAGAIYSGNPATLLRYRDIRDEARPTTSLSHAPEPEPDRSSARTR